MERLLRREDEHKAAWIKRFMEYDSMIPGFHDEEAADPEAVLKKYGFPLSVEEVSFYPGKPEDRFVMRPVFPESDAAKYEEYVNNKLAYRELIKERNLPANEAMRKWHKRQQGRCLAELGARCDAIVHVPFTIELADGCSIGCPFCGLKAGPLKSVFRYTEENAALFREVLTGAKELIGECVGEGPMYFASEPLDNPDYESFLKEHLQIFGRIPQITTAAALRHKERLHSLLAQLNKDGRTIYRFSVLSKEDALRIFEEFTPEELVFTELLPQYEEAPSASFAKVGRYGEAKNELEGTISCVTGFVVNFSKRTVRLTAPVSADREHPTGELELETAGFDDAEGCLGAIRDMISRHMGNLIGAKERVRLRSGLSWSAEGGEIIVESGKGSRFTVSAPDGGDLYARMFKLFEEGYHTRREIVAELLKGYGDGLVRTDVFYHAINRLWELGLLELESGKI